MAWHLITVHSCSNQAPSSPVFFTLVWLVPDAEAELECMSEKSQYKFYLTIITIIVASNFHNISRLISMVNISINTPNQPKTIQYALCWDSMTFGKTFTCHYSNLTMWLAYQLEMSDAHSTFIIHFPLMFVLHQAFQKIPRVYLIISYVLGGKRPTWGIQSKKINK